jgi:four helix bundle protein
MSEEKEKFDLQERTAKYGEAVIEFARSLPYDRITDELERQIIRSATSIGANYMEANGATSKKDFKFKIDLCKKESKETKPWLRMIAKANSNFSDTCRTLWQEAHELALIFSSISLTCERNQ